MSEENKLLPEIVAEGWLNTDGPIRLAQQRGKVVVIHAFQMLCPGCVVHGIPQTSAIYELYSREQVTVIGLHSVFEHHAVMTEAALRAFVHEYRLQFPIAIDRPNPHSRLPVTMQQYQLQGTPSLLLVDKTGHLRLNYFGRLSDMQVGNMIGQLVQQNPNLESEENTSGQLHGCNKDGCAV